MMMLTTLMMILTKLIMTLTTTDGAYIVDNSDDRQDCGRGRRVEEGCRPRAKLTPPW